MALNYTPKTPLVQFIERRKDGVTIPYTKMEIPEEFGASFWLPRNLPFTAATMSDLYLSDAFIDEVAKCSSAYARKNQSKRKYIPITRKDVLNFFAVYQYMGIVRLPAKEDYFVADGFWPVHPLLQGLTKSWFQYMFRNIHMVETDMLDVEEPLLSFDDLEDEEVEDEELDEMDETPDETRQVDNRWYAKAAPILDHFLAVSHRICKHPGFALAIDEMMKRFKGRSGQTLRIKNKPIKEGYKFFAICDSLTGFVFNLIPDGRLEKCTIYEYVNQLVESLPFRDTKKYLVAMDNYFTYPKILHRMRELCVACVGTARAKRGWPPQEMRTINDNRFNTLYSMNDEMGFRVFRWVDNNVVTMVSSFHDGDEPPPTRRRRRPRPTSTNRGHVQAVWGNEGVADIAIPALIDDYNHYMGGVDKADQLIAYYRPDLRCRRVWMPIMFHVLDCMRTNSYAACKASGYKESHKDFTMEWCKALSNRAKAETVRETRQRRTAAANEYNDNSNIHGSILPPSKRRRMSHTNPELPAYRFSEPKEDHHKVDLPLDKKARTCTYCSYLYMLNKASDQVPEPPKKSKGYCFACGDFLCREHFDIFHQKDDIDAEDHDVVRV